jgi:hypothetical protein
MGRSRTVVLEYLTGVAALPNDVAWFGIDNFPRAKKDSGFICCPFV